MNATPGDGSHSDASHGDAAQGDVSSSGDASCNAVAQCDEQRNRVLAAIGQHELSLTRYAARLTGDEHAARDVVQHVFLQLCDKPPTAKNGQLAGWLFSVCHNRAMDYRRQSGKATSLETVPPECMSAGGLQRGGEVDPADKAEADDTVDLLRSVIDTLPDQQRLVINLWSAGFCYREIAAALDTSEGSVRVAAHRAWQTVRQHPKVRKLLTG